MTPENSNWRIREERNQETRNRYFESKISFENFRIFKEIENVPIVSPPVTVSKLRNIR